MAELFYVETLSPAVNQLLSAPMESLGGIYANKTKGISKLLTGDLHLLPMSCSGCWADWLGGRAFALG